MYRYILTQLTAKIIDRIRNLKTVDYLGKKKKSIGEKWSNQKNDFTADVVKGSI